MLGALVIVAVVITQLNLYPFVIPGSGSEDPVNCNAAAVDEVETGIMPPHQENKPRFHNIPYPKPDGEASPNATQDVLSTACTSTANDYSPLSTSLSNSPILRLVENIRHALDVKSSNALEADEHDPSTKLPWGDSSINEEAQESLDSPGTGNPTEHMDCLADSTAPVIRNEASEDEPSRTLLQRVMACLSSISRPVSVKENVGLFTLAASIAILARQLVGRKRQRRPALAPAQLAETAETDEIGPQSSPEVIPCHETGVQLEPLQEDLLVLSCTPLLSEESMPTLESALPSNESTVANLTADDTLECLEDAACKSLSFVDISAEGKTEETGQLKTTSPPNGQEPDSPSLQSAILCPAIFGELSPPADMNIDSLQPLTVPNEEVEAKSDESSWPDSKKILVETDEVYDESPLKKQENWSGPASDDEICFYEVGGVSSLPPQGLTVGEIGIQNLELTMIGLTSGSEDHGARKSPAKSNVDLPDVDTGISEQDAVSNVELETDAAVLDSNDCGYIKDQEGEDVGLNNNELSKQELDEERISQPTAVSDALPGASVSRLVGIPNSSSLAHVLMLPQEQEQINLQDQHRSASESSMYGTCKLPVASANRLRTGGGELPALHAAFRASEIKDAAQEQLNSDNSDSYYYESDDSDDEGDEFFWDADE